MRDALARLLLQPGPQPRGTGQGLLLPKGHLQTSPSGFLSKKTQHSLTLQQKDSGSTSCFMDNPPLEDLCGL